MKKAIPMAVAAAVLGVVLSGTAFAYKLGGQVFFHTSEEAPCCEVTLWTASGCGSGYLEGTTTDSCGDYAFQTQLTGGVTYYVKVRWGIMECAAWKYHGTCPATTVCEAVTIDPNGPNNQRHDVYLGLLYCYNDSCP